jgi:hypothetical protein
VGEATLGKQTHQPINPKGVVPSRFAETALENMRFMLRSETMSVVQNEYLPFEIQGEVENFPGARR